MPRIKSITLYKYDELPTERAKERARDWFRSGDTDDFWSEYIVDDLQEVAKACGLSIGGRNPNNRSDKGIYWSGFSSQGDGASFNATWRADHLDAPAIAALIADRPLTYTDSDGKTQPCKGNAELVPILEAFRDLAAAAPNGYGAANASHRGHYMDTGYNIGDCPICGCVDDGQCECESPPVRESEDSLEGRFTNAVRDLAHWFYRSLEREYDYHTSDECVAENIRCNEYEFTEDGSRG